MQKENGIYYTPPGLADYLAKPLLNGKSQPILDPSYGEGSLLLAAERVYKTLTNTSQIQLYGCDTKPVNGLLKHLPEANLMKMDFFDYSVDNKFQTILMNPPYVRHHILDNELLEKYRKQYQTLSVVKNNADLWAYFVAKATLHLQPGGSIGAILPWAFMQADYAQPIRKLIHENFKEIKLLSLNKQYFENAEERIVLLWLKGFGGTCSSIDLAFSRDTSGSINYSKLSEKHWTSEKIIYNGNNSVHDIVDRFQKEYKFTRLGDHADVKIGIVTGAVDFFIMPEERAREFGFTKSDLVPILSSARQFSNLLNGDMSKLEYCVKIKEKDAKKFKDFIQIGVDFEYHLRAHSQLRSPWYAVKIGQIPDAFFPYRVVKIPYLLMNDAKVQSTNSIHRIYFKKLTDVEKKWIHVSLLCSISQLSLEANSKTYGREMLKLEPTAIKRSIVLKRKDKSVIPVYNRIVRLLADGKKDEAVVVATTFINRKLKIPNATSEAVSKMLSDLQRGRVE